MIEIYLKYDNMHIFGMINAFNCINNHVISCINSMLSVHHFISFRKNIRVYSVVSGEKKHHFFIFICSSESFSHARKGRVSGLS